MCAQALVHGAHETVEVRAAFFGDRQAVVEQVDQKGLAAADAAPEIQAARDRCVGLAEQGTQPPLARRRGEQVALDAVEFEQRRMLRAIVAPVSAGDAGRIARGCVRRRRFQFSHARREDKGERRS